MAAKRIEALASHLTAPRAPLHSSITVEYESAGSSPATTFGEVSEASLTSVAASARIRPAIGVNPTRSLKGKTIVITGASRGIGLAIALAAAREGANIAILAKTAAPHPKLEGTIFSAAVEIERCGGQALPIPCDVRFEDQITSAVEKTVARFGGIDILVNNASAISLTATESTPAKVYDLMHQVNGRGTFLCTQKCLPYLRKSAGGGHVLNISPPLSMTPHWFAPHAAYTAAKYLMSMYALGMAQEFKDDGIAVNCLWPRTAVATAAVKNMAGDEGMSRSRTVDVMADSAIAILKSPSTCTANFFIDDEVLSAIGITDLSRYNVDPRIPQEELVKDFFLPE